MNDTPTPESDKAKIAFTSLFANDDAYWIPYVVGIKLERERDEAREQLAEIEAKMRGELGGHPDSELWGDAGLIAATMRCVDALDVVTEQRDRLADALRKIKNELGVPQPEYPAPVANAVKIADEALQSRTNYERHTDTESICNRRSTNN